MKKAAYLLTVALLTLILVSCGMSPKQISTAIVSAETDYQSGAYADAQKKLDGLDKVTKKMTEEQKSRYTNIKTAIDSALQSADTIKYSFDSAQNLYNQGMYYEANAELDKLAATYTLPPVEQEIFNAKKDLIAKGIKIEDDFKKVSSAFNNKDYNTASSILLTMDASIMTDTQKQNYQTWNTKVSNAKSEEAAAAAAAAARKERAAQAVQIGKQNVAAALGLNINLVKLIDAGNYYSAYWYNNFLGDWIWSGYNVDKETGAIIN